MNLHFHIDNLTINIPVEKIDQILELVIDNNKYLKHIAMKQKELIPIVQEIATIVTKVNTEVAAVYKKVSEDPDADPELVAAIQSIKAGLQGIDNIIPDMPTEPPVEPPVEPPTETV